MTGKTFVNKDEQLRLMCNATGGESLPDEIDWFFKGEKLSTDDAKGISIVKQVNLMDRTIHSVLKIKSAQMTDAGSYVCRTSDLQVNSAQVEVLNAESKNIKREITNSSQDKYDIPKSRHDRLDKSGSENGGNVSSPSSGQHIILLIIFLICLVTLLTDGYKTTMIVT
ncbi:protein cepu-1 [Plakobranchus ocellatus]|uniref:Protein cepu-1 n=1 Tax=Plakobranchus ocellatus TaxID=259542 RepID=A0AAV4AHA6_9GAST|nr:protein cepu-1 [Plakobranchus ocellatus]